MQVIHVKPTSALSLWQDPKVVVSVLMKLAGGCPSLADDLNVDSFLNQARSYDEASNTPFGWYLRLVSVGRFSFAGRFLILANLVCCFSLVSGARTLRLIEALF